MSRHTDMRSTVPRCAKRRTGRLVKFENTGQTRQAVDSLLKTNRKKPGESLFTGRRGPDRRLTTRQYARLLPEGIAGIDLDPSLFETHAIRRTEATLIYRRTGTSAPSSYCWGTRRSKAPSGSSASRSMMRSPSPNRSTSDQRAERTRSALP